MLDKIIDYFQLELTETKDGYSGVCPLHGSADNPNAFHINERGHFKCYSHECHNVFRPANIFGLCRGLLSKHKCGWSSKGDPIYNYEDTVKFLKSLGHQHKQTNSDVKDTIKFIKKRKKTRSQLVQINDSFLNLVEIPSKYYLGRSYLPATLIKYRVGDCLYSGAGALYGRAVVPIWQHGRLIGYTARSHADDKCSYCKQYHIQEIKCSNKSPKWIHTPGISTSHLLYNLDFAKSAILENNKCILVEGPGDIWRLEESGINYGLAILGKELSLTQQRLLFRLNVGEVVLALDGDGPGQTAATNIYNQLKQYVKTRISKPTAKDIGEMSAEEIRKLFGVINE